MHVSANFSPGAGAIRELEIKHVFAVCDARRVDAVRFDQVDRSFELKDCNVVVDVACVIVGMGPHLGDGVLLELGLLDARVKA